MAELQKDGGSCEVTGLLGEEGEESQAVVPGLHRLVSCADTLANDSPPFRQRGHDQL